jgi:hypothetical protein
MDILRYVLQASIKRMKIAKKILSHIPMMKSIFSAEETRKLFISKKIESLNDPIAKEINRDLMEKISGMDRKEIRETEK